MYTSLLSMLIGEVVDDGFDFKLKKDARLPLGSYLLSARLFRH